MFVLMNVLLVVMRGTFLALLAFPHLKGAQVAALPNTLAMLGIKNQRRLSRWLERLDRRFDSQISEATSLFLQRDGGRMKSDMPCCETESSDLRARYPRATNREETARHAGYHRCRGRWR